jgi:hypothetical protein
MMGFLKPAFLLAIFRHRGSVDIPVTYGDSPRPIKTYK